MGFYFDGNTEHLASNFRDLPLVQRGHFLLVKWDLACSFTFHSFTQFLNEILKFLNVVQRA